MILSMQVSGLFMDSSKQIFPDDEDLPYYPQDLFDTQQGPGGILSYAILFHLICVTMLYLVYLLGLGND